MLFIESYINHLQAAKQHKHINRHPPYYNRHHQRNNNKQKEGYAAWQYKISITRMCNIYSIIHMELYLLH